MLLLDEWRKAVQSVAATNDQGSGEGSVSQWVDAERERIECERRQIELLEVQGMPAAKFRASLANTILQGHAAIDLSMLQDYVTYLIWGKLTKASEALPDAFPGITDLHAYFDACVPARYSASQVDEFIQSLGPPTRLGDVRSFLCARPGAKRQLYSHDQVDVFLLKENLEELRFSPPASVGEGLPRREREKERRRFQRKKDQELCEILFDSGWRGIPRSIIGWALMISRQLVTGTCDCARQFTHSSKAYASARRRCRDYHFLSLDNLRRGERQELYQQKQAMADPLTYVERAVIEKMLQTHHKNFAKTMLCHVFETPRGNSLRLGVYWNGRQWIEGLTETGREVPWEGTAWMDRRQKKDDLASADTGQVIRCFGCPECLCFIGDEASQETCIREQHHWCCGSIPRHDPEQQEPLTDGLNVSLSIRCCASKHFWPGDAAEFCPLCGQQSVCEPQPIEMFCPTNRSYQDVEDWRETLGG